MLRTMGSDEGIPRKILKALKLVEQIEATVELESGCSNTRFPLVQSSLGVLEVFAVPSDKGNIMY